jgi:TonB family protein
MSYRYLKKGKKLSSEEIKSMMNFDKILENAATLEVINLPKDAFSADRKNSKRAWWIMVPLLLLAVYFIMPSNDASSKQLIEGSEVNNTPNSNVDRPDSIIIDNAEAPKKENGIAQKEKENKERSLPTTEKEPIQSIDIKSVPPVNQPKQDSFQKEVEKEDVFVGAQPKMGFDEFYSFIDNELTYPESATTNILEGYVKVLFAISAEGKISDFVIQETLGEAFDKEAIRVLNLVGDWLPATFNSEPVKSQFSIKMRFKLNN